MALQMHSAKTPDITQPLAVEPHDIRQVPGVGDEAVETIVGRGRVGRCSLVPEFAVRPQIVVHYWDTAIWRRRSKADSPRRALIADHSQAWGLRPACPSRFAGHRRAGPQADPRAGGSAVGLPAGLVVICDSGRGRSDR